MVMFFIYFRIIRVFPIRVVILTGPSLMFWHS
jgi:hypothetical protein